MANSHHGDASPPYLLVLARRWKLIAACTVLVAVAGYLFAARQPAEFQAATSLLLRDQTQAQVVGGNPFQSSIDATRRASTNLALISEPVVARIAAPSVDLPPEVVFGSVTVAAKAQSDVVSVIARRPSPYGAIRVADAYARAVIDFRKQTDLEVLRQAETATRNRLTSLTAEEREAVEGQDLETRLRQLRYLQTISSGNAQIIQPAGGVVQQVAPRPMRSAVLGGLLGLLAGLGVAAGLNHRDGRLRESGDAEQIFDGPILTVVPKSPELAKPDPVAAPPPRVVESFQMLRETLRARHGRQHVRTLMVTSALPDEGKSTIAWHLAMTEASMGANVLLVEADLRRPVLGRRYGTEAHKTVADVALGGVSLAEAVVRHPVPNSPFQTLSLLLANPTATPVVAPEHLIHLVREASKDFDIVVVDAASPLAVAETVALLSAVDGVIVVSRISRSTEAASRRLSQLLQDLKTPVLGVVINAEEPAWSYPALVEPAVRLERS